ncbi:MAG: argininosuccinate lyase [Pseudohongiellaceae bacterium]
MSEKFPAQGYKDNVLSDCFADAQRYFLDHYLDVDRAHVLMLAEQGIITQAELGTIVKAIQDLDVETMRSADYDGSVEDLFFYIQREIATGCGDPDVAGKLHTARSRNDIDVTIYRLFLRKQALQLIESCEDLRKVFINLAAKHHDALMPAYTHTQPAQPTTVAHYILAMIENVSRDITRLQRAYENMNHCPLGACAITTTGFPIDRHRVAELLGFDGPTRNSYGSIASVDYFTELLGVTSTLLINIGKFSQEFLLMAMMEFNVIRLPDGYVQASSIMPQKRNPVAIEHVRAIASKALGQTLGVLTSVHNTPFGDINDVEDDLQPLNFAAIRDATRAVSLLGHSLGAAEFNLDLLKDRAESNFITVTELADVIVRKEKLPFSVAHKIVALCVKQATEKNSAISFSMLQTAARQELDRDLEMLESEFTNSLSAENFVAVRTIYGGPSPVETKLALAEQKKAEAQGQEWLRNARQLLNDAEDNLQTTIDHVLSH